MSKTPTAAPHTEGRTFGTDWSIANVAKLIRSNAARGMWRHSEAGGHMAMVNQNYIRTVSARHLPTNVSLIFMRLERENCWYASLCFALAGEIQPWNGDAAERWLQALFGEDRPRVLEDTVVVSGERRVPGTRQFTLATQGERR